MDSPLFLARLSEYNCGNPSLGKPFPSFDNLSCSIEIRYLSNMLKFLVKDRFCVDKLKSIGDLFLDLSSISSLLNLSYDKILILNSDRALTSLTYGVFTSLTFHFRIFLGASVVEDDSDENASFSVILCFRDGINFANKLRLSSMLSLR